uniref:CREG-like beta-barrel domain-containing protein n=1 Tax=Sus scrofa TaxID=9823 RepID=A0A8D1VLL6_PIG
MSGRRGQRPGHCLCWLLCCVLLSPAAGYVIVSSVSWAVTNEVDEELDSASTEETLPTMLEDSGSIWQRSFPASAHKEDAHLPPPVGAAGARPPPEPPGMFSYRREGGARLRPGTARFLAHASAWGCLATVSAHEKMPGLPFGNCLPISDGPFNNSTGIPFFYVTPKDPVVADLMKNPMASLLLPESEGEFFKSCAPKTHLQKTQSLNVKFLHIWFQTQIVEFPPQCSGLRIQLQWLGSLWRHRFNPCLAKWVKGSHQECSCSLDSISGLGLPYALDAALKKKKRKEKQIVSSG